MTSEHLKKQGYGRRWHIESFFSGLKRMMGSALSSRTDGNLLPDDLSLPASGMAPARVAEKAGGMTEVPQA
jgi:hypothetical protein